MLGHSVFWDYVLPWRKDEPHHKSSTPKALIAQVDNFPAIGTVEDPAYAWMGRNLLIAYEIAPVNGNGCALIFFKDASDVSIFPLNTEGLYKNKLRPYVPKFNIKPLQINEISGDPKTEYWKFLKPRRWIISFNDYTMDIVFEDVELKEASSDIHMPDQMLLKHIDYLKNVST